MREGSHKASPRIAGGGYIAAVAKPNPLPAAVWLAGTLTLAAGAGLAAVALASVAASPHEVVAWGIGAVLGVWAAIVLGGAVGLFRGRRWARGPVVAAALLHLASAASFAASQPWAWLAAGAAALTLVAALWPSTTAFLGWGPARTRPSSRSL